MSDQKKSLLSYPTFNPSEKSPHQSCDCAARSISAFMSSELRLPRMSETTDERSPVRRLIASSMFSEPGPKYRSQSSRIHVSSLS